MELNKSSFTNKPRNMGITPTATTPRDQHRSLKEGDADKRNSGREENHFSFGKIPNKKG